MTRALSMDLRARAMARLDAGESVRAVAAALSVAPSSVVKWHQRLRATGSIAPDKVGGHVPPKIGGPRRDWLVERTAASAFTLRGLVVELAERGLRVDYRYASGSSSARTASASKKPCWLAVQDRADVARKRVRWKARQASIDPRRLVFIDETCLS